MASLKVIPLIISPNEHYTHTKVSKLLLPQHDISQNPKPLHCHPEHMLLPSSQNPCFFSLLVPRLCFFPCIMQANLLSIFCVCASEVNRSQFPLLFVLLIYVKYKMYKNKYFLAVKILELLIYQLQ